MAQKFVVANINHCARSQDLLHQSLAQWSIEICVVSEPYLIPDRENWAGDKDGTVAVVTNTSANSLPFKSVRKGHGCVAARIGDIEVIGVYFSPNRLFSEFEIYMAQLGVFLSGCNRRDNIIVAGDLNAKSVAWGSPATDVQGELVEDWVVANGLTIMNRGTVHTCVRRRGGSIVDITFASPALASRILDWKVVTDAETLSDHRYVRFDLTLPNLPRAAPTAPPVELGPRWALKRLDRETLVLASLVESWSPDPDCVNPDNEAEWFGGAMSHICDSAMPRVRALPPRTAVHWWSPELARLREACVTARRRYSRHRRRRNRDETLDDALYASYQQAKRDLRGAIGAAKNAAWEEMLETLKQDPWGRPYRLVMSKLRPWAPPLTTTTDPDLLENILDGLFPARTDFTPPVLFCAEGVSAEEAPVVSEGELGAAILRLQAKNTAPGPDGLPGKAWVLALKSGLEPRFRALLTVCLKEGYFPQRWKTGKLVLLKKEGRPADSPSAYRPIVLLNEAAKLLERIVAARLSRHLEEEGPDLADNQYGFRRGRSTIDAIERVKALAREEVARGGCIVAVSLDIANAFNSLPHGCALSRLMPNLGGPHTGCRRLFTGVVRSMAMYGAPVWVDALSRENVTELRRPQRALAKRVIRAYCTVSREAACALAGTPPWELEAEVLAEVYHRTAAARRSGNPPAQGNGRKGARRRSTR
ncbi:hypothetical protein ABMA27_008766 [Loxostege sticticalis]|uniref:Reverse transcriptase domain-containing protein n=1 Tax=Loxostege sticticalis TaxID=481309 RepID=A0ABR3H8S8_LOXSC